MKKLLFSIIFLGTVFVLNAQKIRHTEILGRPTDKSITVQLFFTEDADIAVEYGTSSGNYTNKTPYASFVAGDPAEIEIGGLTPNTKYYYRVNSRKTGSTTISYRPEFTFVTAKPANTPFTFVIQADPHLDAQSDTNIYKLCLKNQLEDKPDFQIDLGDILMSDKLFDQTKKIPRDTVTFRSHLMRSYYELINHSVPLFIALGNHEGESGWNLNGTAQNVAVWGTVDRKKYFTNPAPNGFYTGDTIVHPFVGQRENYYAWAWGDAQFIVLDPYWYTKPKPDSLNGWRWSLGKVQYDWLKATLEKSNSKFKFVFAHQLVGGDPDGRGGVEYAERYEWGGNNLNGIRGFETNRPGWYKPIKDLFKEHRVNVFFHGHDHFFAKQEKECLIYQEVPQPSHPNFMNASSAKAYGYLEGQILPNSGHIRVSVAPEGVKVEYVRTYLPKNETGSRHNKDVSASYYIGAKNCYDSMSSTGIPILYNSNYSDEIAYPNPFEKETTIQFSVLKSENLSIQILNSNGQMVRELIANQNIPVGNYKVIWDGTNTSGANVNSGMYWYSIKSSSNEIKTGKIILNR